MIKPTVKTFAFFDSKAVTARLDPATRKFLGWGAGLIRKVARRSLRPARQKKISEMSQEEIDTWTKRVESAQARGLPRPRRPEVVSEPGEPPKLHQKDSPLKRIYYGLELKTETAVIGPNRERSGIANVLEHGGTSNGHRIEARPFMGRAQETVTPQMPAYWDNLLNK